MRKHTHTHTFKKRKLVHGIFVLKVKYLPVKNYLVKNPNKASYSNNYTYKHDIKNKATTTNTHTHTWTFISTINQNLIREKQLNPTLKQIKMYVEHLHSDKHAVIWVTKTVFDDQHD